MKTFRVLILCLAVCLHYCHAVSIFDEESTTSAAATSSSTTVESVSCAGEALSSTYLSGLTKTSISNFIPSVYYNGGSAKFVTSEEGKTTLDHSWLCVDGSDNAGPIELYDDGTNGDDVAGDGIYSRNCVHYCSSNVNFDDMFGFAMATDISGQKFIVMDPAKEGTVPSVEIYEADIPLTPGAKAFASSHAFFFADVNKKYYPNFPNTDGGFSTSPNHAGHPNGKSVGVAALLQVFGDVFDFVTSTPLEGKFNGGVYKWQNWDRRGGPQPDAEIGEADKCSTALTGVPIHRLVGGITMPHLAEGGEWRSQMHEIVHGISGYEFNNNLEAARTGDGMHVPGSCTMDHSSLQGPIWDWVQGAPTSIPRSDGKDGGLRLEANSECDDCPDDDLANCCSFRYLDSPFTAAEFLANPEIGSMSPLMQYIAGFIKMKDVPKDKRTYYCMGSDTDGSCGEEDFHVKKCVYTVDDSNRSKVKSEFVTRASFEELVDSNGGSRFPERKFDVIRNGNVIYSARIPTEAEITFHTLFWRQMEIMAEPWERINDDKDAQQHPMLSWRFETGGKSVIHSRLHGIDCGENSSSIPSCGNGNGNVCAGAPCGPGAVCKNFDGHPLCMCKEGLIGDGYECVFPSETVMYERLPSAQDLANDSAFATQCFPENNVWPNFTDVATLPPYPGGQSPYAPTSCFEQVCAVGWRCNKKKRKCLPPTSRNTCEGKGFNKGKCLAMGCCIWKGGKCNKRSGNSCPRVEDPTPSTTALCDNEDTCCYFRCDMLSLDDDGQIGQIGNCGKDCTVAVLPDYRGIKFDELYLVTSGYYTGEQYYGYDTGPMDIQGTNKNMLDRCKDACFGAPREDPTAIFLLDIKKSNDFAKKKSCEWLSSKPAAAKKRICVKRNLSTRGLSPAGVVCPVTCAPYL